LRALGSGSTRIALLPNGTLVDLLRLPADIPEHLPRIDRISHTGRLDLPGEITEGLLRRLGLVVAVRPIQTQYDQRQQDKDRAEDHRDYEPPTQRRFHVAVSGRRILPGRVIA
jgi:hypothetical protein